MSHKSVRVRRRSQPAHEEGHANHERWLITYGDMLTLLRKVRCKVDSSRGECTDKKE